MLSKKSLRTIFRLTENSPSSSSHTPSSLYHSLQISERPVPRIMADSLVVLDEDVGEDTSNSELSISSNSISTSSPKPSGRSRNYIWSHFVDEGDAKAGAYRKARCRYCASVFNYAKVSMMYNHIANQCDAVLSINPAARVDVIGKLAEADRQIQSPKSMKRALQVSIRSLLFVHKYPFRRSFQLYDMSPASKQMRMDQYGSRAIPANERLEIDRSLLRAFIMNGMPFHAVASPFFSSFVQKLNPSYQLPDRMKLTRQTLTNEVIHVEKQNDTILTEASYLTLNIDGWSDKSKRSLYEFNVITESRRAVVLALIDLSAYSHTAEFLLGRLEMVLNRASTTFNIIVKIVAIVTDNPSVMQKLRDLFISKPDRQHILSFRCFAHAVNLIAGKDALCLRYPTSHEQRLFSVVGDVVKHSFAARVISKISTVTCYFNKSHAFKAKLKEESLRLKSNKETLDTIVVTRWTSVADCLRSFLVLRTPLQMIASMEKDNLPAKIVNIISHRTFFSDIEQFYSIMKALSYAVTIIQSRTATLGDCYLILTYLHAVTSNFPKQSDMIEFARYVSKVAKIRLDEFENPYYLACFYLHPKYRGAGLLAKSRAAVYRCIAEYSKLIGNSSSMTKSVIAALQRYELKAGPYALIYDKGKPLPVSRLFGRAVCLL